MSHSPTMFKTLNDAKRLRCTVSQLALYGIHACSVNKKRMGVLTFSSYTLGFSSVLYEYPYKAHGSLQHKDHLLA